MTNLQQATPPSDQGTLAWLTYTDARDTAMARRGVINAVLFTLAFGGVLIRFLGRLFLAATLQSRDEPLTVVIQMVVALAMIAAMFYANRRGFILESGLAFALFGLASNFLLIDLTSNSLPGPAILLVPVLAAALLGPPISAFFVAVLAVVGHGIVNVQADPDYFAELESDAPVLANVYIQILLVAFAAWLFARNSSRAMRESAELGTQLVTQRETLEDRVNTQSRYLQATTLIARSIVGARDIEKLLDDTVKLVQNTFGYYHVQVFLVDEDSDQAVLRSSTGEAGRVLLERGHRLPVGSLSVIGQVTAASRPVIARDTDADAVHRRNELLPDTRSEMALPLTVGGRMMGALDLQSTEPDAFGADVIPILQSLADQLAVAIENARLYTQTQRSMRELEELYGEVTERSWADFLAQARDPEKRQVYGPETQALEVQRSTVVKRVLGSGGVIISTGADGRQSFIAAPIVVRNEVVGVLGVEPDGSREWTQDDVALLQGIAERTALAVENARLYLQSQRAADRERLVNTISARLQRAPSLQMLLQSVAEELSGALGTDNVYAEISLGEPLAVARTDVTEDGQPVEGQARPTAESEEVGANQ